MQRNAYIWIGQFFLICTPSVQCSTPLEMWIVWLSSSWNITCLCFIVMSNIRRTVVLMAHSSSRWRARDSFVRFPVESVYIPIMYDVAPDVFDCRVASMPSRRWHEQHTSRRTPGHASVQLYRGHEVCRRGNDLAEGTSRRAEQGEFELMSQL